MLHRTCRALIGLGIALLAASDASAHVFIGDGGPGAGFIHPLTGPDHLLAMFTVGLLSARLGGSAIWTVPAAFLFGMSLGGALGIRSIVITYTDYGVAASVVILGAMLITARRPIVPLVLGSAALFGLFHGYEHGLEMPRVVSPGLYALGFLAATAGLHLMGALTGLLVECRRNSEQRFRAAGTAVTIVGLLFVSQLVFHSSAPVSRDRMTSSLKSRVV